MDTDSHGWTAISGGFFTVAFWTGSVCGSFLGGPPFHHFPFAGAVRALAGFLFPFEFPNLVLGNDQTNRACGGFVGPRPSGRTLELSGCFVRADGSS